MRDGSRWGGVAGCLLAAIAIAALGASSASAAYQHPAVTESFGPDGTSASTFTVKKIAFNQADKRLYALDGASGNTKLYAFDAPTAGTHTPAGGNFPISTGNAEFGPSLNELATDDTTLGSAGNLYYVSGSSGAFGFDSGGNALGGGFPIPQPGGVFGVAVDGKGHVWVADSSNQAVREYSSAGTTTRTSIDTSAGETRQIAFDRSNGNLYVSGYFGLLEYTAASGYTDHVEIEGGETIESLAVDSTTHTVYLAHPYPGDITAYNSSGARLETFATSLSGIDGVAVNEDTGTVYVSTESGRVNVIPGVVVPDVATGEATANATLNGHVDPAGGGDVTSCNFEYGTDASYGSTIPCSTPNPPPYGAPTDVSADIPGAVTPETTYHYRLVAANANGTNLGADQTVTPHFVSGLRTDAATDLGKSTATLHAHFTGSGEDTHYYFEWGETSAYGSRSATPPGDTVSTPTGNTPLSFGVTGLDPGTTYHYRVVAANGQGFSLGGDRTFTTVKAVPDLETEPPTELSAISGTLHGSYTGELGIDNSCHFEWGTSSAYGNSTPTVDQGSGTGSQDVSAQLGSLKELTSYHFRVVCHNDTYGDAFGEDQLLTTFALPAIAILPPSKFTSPDAADPTASVKLNATVNPQHGGDTTYHFEYGATAAYGTSTPESPSLGSGGATYPVSVDLSGLQPGTVYHYRLVATSAAGVRASTDQTLTTVPMPPLVLDTSATGVTLTTATLSTTVNPGFGATVVFFDFGPTAAYGSSTRFTDPTPADDAGHALSAQLTGLSPGTTYHYRAVAVNFNRATPGPDRTFTTSEEVNSGGGGGSSGVPTPVVPPSPVPPTPEGKKKQCRKNFVMRKGRCVKRKQHQPHKRRHRHKGGGRNG